MNVSILNTANEVDGAEKTFSRIIELINTAESNIEIHMYVWRSDAIGNAIGNALCKAADRGVKIHIKKDHSALMYEWIEMNRKSYLPGKISKLKRIWWNIIRRTFPKTFVEDDFIDGAGLELTNKKNVTIEWIKKVKTHQKYYLFDNKTLVTGSINIEERHRDYYDYMIHIEENDLCEHFHSRMAGERVYNLDQNIEFIFNQPMNNENRFEIKPVLIQLIDQAKENIYVEVAYIGDHDVDEAIINAANRNVKVDLILSKAANIGNENNYKRAELIMKNSSAKIYLSSKMIHSKMLAFDRKIVVSGSANLSIFSMQYSGELNVLIKDPKIVRDFMSLADTRKQSCDEVTDIGTLGNYSSMIAFLQEFHQKLKL